MRGFTKVAAMLCILFASSIAPAREIHVAKSGNDANAGSSAAPYLTIGKAAQVATAGDTVTVHAGTYREYVAPARGGSSETVRITYRAAPGERAAIKGSERITGWVSQGGGVWQAQVPAATFGSYNPYTLTVNGDYMTYGAWHHRGDVYFNDSALVEKQSGTEVASTAKSWYCSVSGTNVVIAANFGTAADPNAAETEINVREMIFAPSAAGVNYITVKGFVMRHAATTWAPPAISNQTGAVWARGGHHWIIEDNDIAYSRCSGISIGLAQGASGSNIETVGHHLIRNNIIRRCGQVGVVGMTLSSASQITGNYIEYTNYRDEFGGWETSGIKVHWSVDLIIKNNYIYYVRGSAGGYGIWIDYANQNTRITGNVIYNTSKEAIYLEANHGPILIDNNVILGSVYSRASEGAVWVHNLMVNSGNGWTADGGDRGPGYYTPHTMTTQQGTVSYPRNDKWLNNIFIQRGCPTPSAAGFVVDYNVYYQGAAKNALYDAHSVADAFSTGYIVTRTLNTISISFNTNATAFSVLTPLITTAYIGTITPPGQGIDNHDGSALTIDRDYFGNARNLTHPVPGPFETLRQGANSFLLFTVPGTGGTTAVQPGARQGHFAATPAPARTAAAATTLFDIHGRLVKKSGAAQLHRGAVAQGMCVALNRGAGMYVVMNHGK